MSSRIYVSNGCCLSTNGVKLISGGREAYELVFLRYLCTNVLNAAIVGSEYSTPTADEIYSFIKDFSQHNNVGIIAVIPDSLEEVINFKLAIERANHDEISVTLLAVNDCCELNKYRRPNFVDLTIVLKLAGTMKELSFEMNEIYTVLKKLSIKTVSCFLKKHFSFINCTFEQGTGRFIPNADLSNIVTQMLNCLHPDPEICQKSKYPLILLVNSNYNEEIFMKELILEILRQLNSRKQEILRIYFGNFVFGPRGYSISFLEKPSDRLIKLADIAYKNHTWPNWPSIGRLHPSTAHGPYMANTMFIEVPIKFACEAMISSKDLFNKLDINNSFGNLIFPALNVVNKMASENKISFNHPYILFNEISMVFKDYMKGYHGEHFKILFSGLANAFSYYLSEVPVVQQMWVEALVHGIYFLKTYTTFKERELALIDVLCPFSSHLAHHLNRLDKNLFEKLSDALNDTNKTLEGTYNIDLPHKKKGHPEISMQAAFVTLTAIIQGIRVVMNVTD